MFKINQLTKIGILLAGTLSFLSSNCMQKRYLASYSDDKTIRVWDLSKEKGKECIRVLKGHNGRVYSMMFHPTNNNKLVSLSDKTIRGWDLSKEKGKECVEVLKVHTKKFLKSLDSISNKAFLVINNTIKVFDQSKKEGEKGFIRVLKGHTGNINVVRFHPTNSNEMVTGSSDKTIRVWDLSKEEKEKGYCRVLNGHTKQVNLVVFSLYLESKDIKYFKNKLKKQIKEKKNFSDVKIFCKK
ncbi:hypothetical protein ACFLYU_02105 [Candidatus Dependentiae bacterium]